MQLTVDEKDMLLYISEAYGFHINQLFKFYIEQDMKLRNKGIRTLRTEFLKILNNLLDKKLIIKLRANTYMITRDGLSYIPILWTGND